MKQNKIIHLISILLFAMLLSVYLLTAGEGLYSIDGEVLFSVTWALATKGTLDISCDLGVPGRDGRCFSNYGFFMPLASVPLVWLANGINQLVLQQPFPLVARFFVARFNQIITAANAVLLFHLALRFYEEYVISLIVALLYGVGTYAWPYAKFHFREPLAALGLLLGIYGIFSFADSDDLCKLLLSGLGFAFATFTRLSSLLCFILTTFYLERKLQQIENQRSKPQHARAVWWSVLLLSLGIIVFYNWYRFGSILNFGYPGESWSTPLFEGLYGLLLSPGKGIFWYSPILLPSILGMVNMYTKYRAEVLLLLAFWVSYLLFHAGFWIWWGGDCWGPRYLIPVLPFLTLFAGSLLYSKHMWWLLLLFGPLSILVQVLGVSIDYNYYATSLPTHMQLFSWQYSPLVHSFRLMRAQKGSNLLNSELALLGIKHNGLLVWRWIWGSILTFTSIGLGIILWREN